MSNKLTKKLEDEVVRRVKQDIKTKMLDEEKILQEEREFFTNYLKKKVPTEFTEMIQGKPVEWFKCINEFCTYTETAHRILKGKSRIDLTEPVYVPYYMSNSSISSYNDRDAVSPCLKELNELRSVLNKAENNVRAAFNSCTTVNKLINTYPELKKYVVGEGAKVDLSFIGGK